MNYALSGQFDELCVGQDATYSPSSVGVGGEGYMDCPDDTLSVVAKSSSLISLINQNMDVYCRAWLTTNVPWEALA